MWAKDRDETEPSFNALFYLLDWNPSNKWKGILYTILWAQSQ